MIIKRKLYSKIEDKVEDARLEELLFSEKKDQLEKLLNLTEGIGMEIMKAIEFYKLGEENVNHWLSVAAGKLNEINKTKGITKFHMGLIGALSRSDITGMLSFGDYDKIAEDYSSPTSYINAVKNKLKNQKNNAGEKYTDWLNINKGFLVSNDDYIVYFKFITLCLAGVLNPDNFQGWEIITTKKNEILTKAIPDKPKINLDKVGIAKLLKECVDIISTNITYKDDDKNKDKKNSK